MTTIKKEGSFVVPAYLPSSSGSKIYFLKEKRNKIRSEIGIGIYRQRARFSAFIPILILTPVSFAKYHINSYSTPQIESRSQNGCYVEYCGPL
jgi:hypothetical protein